jgi:hypothetical protein
VTHRLLAQSLISGSRWPGGRVDLEDTEQRIDNSEIVLDLDDFLKGNERLDSNINAVFTVPYKSKWISNRKRKKAPKKVPFRRNPLKFFPLQMRMGMMM